MALEEVGELELAQGGLAAGALHRPPLGRARVVAELGGADPLRLEHVDPLEQAGEQAGRVAADLVTAKRQVVEPLEQDREPVGRAGDLEEGIDPGLERVVAQQALGELRERLDPELLVGALEARLDPGPQVGGGGEAVGQHGDPLGRQALRGEPPKRRTIASVRPDPPGPRISAGPPRWATAASKPGSGAGALRTNRR